MKVWFATAHGVGELKSNVKTSRLCYSVSPCFADTTPKRRKLYGEPSQNAREISPSSYPHVLTIEDLSIDICEAPKPRKAVRPIPADNMEHITVRPKDLSKTFSLGAKTEPTLKAQLVSLL